MEITRNTMSPFGIPHQGPVVLGLKCENSVSRKCEEGVLDITSDTKFSSHESKSMEFWIHVIQCPLLAFHHTVQLKCENSVSRKREYGVFEITRDTKV